MFVEVKHDHAGWKQPVARMNEASSLTSLHLEFKKTQREGKKR